MFRLQGYMASAENYEESQAVLVGIPMDYTVSYKPGSRIGPQQIRTVSYGIEEYSHYLKRSLEDIVFYDAGDISLPIGNVEGSLRQIETVADKLFTDKKFPIFIGGEHLVSFPLIKSCYKHYPDLIVLHFDAHADLRYDYEGEENSHATVMNKIVQMVGKKRVYQFGIRSGTKEEFLLAKDYTYLFHDEIFPALTDVVKIIKDKPVYITLDIDVVDPAFAPGTGTPEPGGCSSKEILSAIYGLKDLNVVGMDIVEVSPWHDQSDITSILGAKLIRESLLAFCKKVN